MKQTKLLSILIVLLLIFPSMGGDCGEAKAQQFPVVFDFASVNDTQNRYTGSLQNGAALTTWTAPGGSTYNVLDLGDSNGYFDLGAQLGNLLKSLGSSFSISVDVLVPSSTDISSNGNFVWCFSYSSSRGYLFLNAKETRYAITNRSYTQEESVNPAQSLTKGKWVNVIYVQNGATGTVYVNNEQKAENTRMTLFPSGIGNDLQSNYLGRSPYDGDAYLRNALYKDFRIYDTALSESQRAERVAAVSAMNSVSDAQAVLLDMESLFVPRVAYKQIKLPAEGEHGSTISWQTSDATHLTADGLVAKQEADRDVPVTLTATFTRGAATQTQTYTVLVKQPEPYSHYLFAFFPSNSNENIYFAVGEDGYNYTTINRDQAVFTAEGHTVMGGLRDPHILRGEDGKFYMVATDMRSALGWASNRGIVLMKSDDLITWTCNTVHFPTKYAGTNLANVTRVWAPQTIYDAKAGKYMIYFSILTNDGTVSYDKDYYCYANADFTDLEGTPTYFYDRGSATIDMDIVYNEADGLYHAFYKNEGSGGICKVTATQLTPAPGEAAGSQWNAPSGTLQQTNEAVEGSGVFRLINDDSWILMYDCYANGHYQFCSSPDLSTFTFVKNTATSGTFTPRHGTVIPITEAEYQALLAAFPCPALTAETDADAEGNLNLTKERISQLCESTDGWDSLSGFRTHSDSRAYTNGEASVNGTWLEHWRDNRTIDANIATKTLRYLPAGTYKLQASCIATWQSDASVTVSGVTFQADDQSVELHTANEVPERYTLQFDIDAADDYTTDFSVTTTDETTANWVAFDNMRLYFIGSQTDYHAALRQMHDDYIQRAEAVYAQLCEAYQPALRAAIDAVNPDQTDYTAIVRQLDALQAAVAVAEAHLASVIQLHELDTEVPAAQSDVSIHYVRATPFLSGELWNTICLPFSLTAAQMQAQFGDDAVVKRLSGVVASGENVTLTFAPVTAMTANEPYILRPTRLRTVYCISGVDLTPVSTPATTIEDIVAFKGAYSNGTQLTTSDFYILDNYFYRSTGSTTIKAYRAYFTLLDASGVKLLSSFDDDLPTGIEDVQSTRFEVQSTDGTLLLQPADVYTVAGQLLRRQTTTLQGLPRGTYIVDGQKVVVK